MQFRTLNSTYEVDFDPPGEPDLPATGQIRRLGGDVDPTHRQGPDGIWQRFAWITPITPGRSVVVVWSVDDLRVKTTVTSEVVWVEETDGRD